MSCIGLSIIFNNDIIVWISMLSKYSCELSENVGISKFISSCSYIGARLDVDLSKITISLYLMSLYFSCFLSQTWNLFSISSFILFATNLASNSESSILSSLSSIDSSFSSFSWNSIVFSSFWAVSIICISAFKFCFIELS